MAVYSYNRAVKQVYMPGIISLGTLTISVKVRLLIETDLSIRISVRCERTMWLDAVDQDLWLHIYLA